LQVLNEEEHPGDLNDEIIQEIYVENYDEVNGGDAEENSYEHVTVMEDDEGAYDNHPEVDQTNSNAEAEEMENRLGRCTFLCVTNGLACSGTIHSCM
jgi:hypothetical protein